MPITLNGTTGITSPGGDTSTSLSTGSLVVSGTSNTSALTVGNVALGAGNATRFKNRIINGDMQIWQRGTTFTNISDGVYTADRWAVTISAAATVTQSTDVPSTDYYYSLKLAPYANATPASFAARQFIEQQNINDVAGKTVTGSAWVKCSKTSVKFRLGAQNATGGADSSQTISVTAATWTKITFSFSSYAAVTAWTSTPNATGGFLDIGFVDSTALTTSDYIYITGVQLEVGSSATGFEYVDITNQLLMCQRYYEVQTAGQYNVMGAYNSGGVFYTQGGVFAVAKRTAPTFSGSGSGGWAVTGVALYSASGATTFGSSSITTSTYALTQTRVAGNSTPSNGAYYIFEGTTTFAFSAEL